MKQKEITYIDDFGRYGCYVASLASLAEKHLERPLERKEFEPAYREAVRKGYVWHNARPTDGSQGDWYRCYVAHPVNLGNLILERVGLPLKLESVQRRLMPGRDFTLICYKTQWGFHFALGDSNGHEVVNPDPRLPLLDVDSYRVFRFSK